VNDAPLKPGKETASGVWKAVTLNALKRWWEPSVKATGGRAWAPATISQD